MNARAVLAALTTSLILCGCGGGGGASGDAGPGPVQGPPPADPATPLAFAALSAAQVDAIAAAAPRESETLLMIGRLSAELAKPFVASSAPARLYDLCLTDTIDWCITATLTDRDGNGRASAGDTIVATAKSAGVHILADEVTGVLSIDILPGADLAAGILKARVGLGDGLYLKDAALRVGMGVAVPRTFRGDFNVDWSMDGTGKSLRVTAAAEDNVRVELNYAGKPYVAAIRGFDLSKQVAYPDARVKLNLKLRYDSAYLGGSVTVATPEPLLAYLGTTPDAGALEFSGAQNDKFVLRPLVYDVVPATLRNDDGYSLRVNGAAPLIMVSKWSNVVAGYLWEGEGSPMQNSTLTFAPLPFWPADVFVTSQPTPDPFPVDGAIALQFSRDIGSAAPLLVRFRDWGSRDNASLAPKDIDATVTRRGALWVVAPSQPLRYSNDYGLSYSTDGVNWSTDVVLRDGAGKSLMRLTQVTSSSTFRTEDALRPAVEFGGTLLQAAGGTFTLSAAGTVDDAGPIAAYHWAQLSGTPLSFGTPDAASTSVAWSTQAPPVLEVIPVRLSVTDGVGVTKTKDVSIVVSNLTPASQALYVHSNVVRPPFWGQPAALTSLNGEFVLNETGNQLTVDYYMAPREPGSLPFELILKPLNGAPVQVGDYPNTDWYEPHGRTTFSFDSLSWACHPGGQVHVREVGRDTAGKIARLALDFEQRCSGTTDSLFGSLRLNSTMPLAP